MLNYSLAWSRCKTITMHLHKLIYTVTSNKQVEDLAAIHTIHSCISILVRCGDARQCGTSKDRMVYSRLYIFNICIYMYIYLFSCHSSSKSTFTADGGKEKCKFLEPATRSDFPRFDFADRSRSMRHVARQFGAGIGMQICKCVRCNYLPKTTSPSAWLEHRFQLDPPQKAKRMQAKWNSLSHFDWPSLAIQKGGNWGLQTEDQPKEPEETGETGLPFRFYWQHVCQVPGASGTVRSPPTRLANEFRDREYQVIAEIHTTCNSWKTFTCISVL